MISQLKYVFLRFVMRFMARHHEKKEMRNHQVQKIAIWQFGGVGDMLLATPVIEALGQRFPEAEIKIWCSNPSFAIFLQQFPHVTSIHQFKVYDFDMRTLMKKKVRKELQMIRKDMAGEHVDLIVNLHIPALLDWWAVEWWLLYQLQPIFTLGFDPKFIVKGSNLDVSVNARERDSRHYTELYQQVMNKAGVSCSLQTIFPIVEKSYVNANILLEQSGLIREHNWVCMHIGGRRLKVENKMWPIDRFSDLAKRLLLKNFQIVLIGVKSECGIGHELCKKEPNIVNMIGKTTLGEMAATIDRSTGFIGHDSGPFHIAVASNTPAVAICGRENAEVEYLKYDRDDVVVLTADSPSLISVEGVYASVLKAMKHE